MSAYTILFIFLCILAVLLVTGVGVRLVRLGKARRNFTPTPDKGTQTAHLNELLKAAGFYYDSRRDLFSTRQDCWQREMGYCRIFDEGAMAFNMVMDCEPIRFSYGGKRWLIELWKGQYGITTGGEIGIYNTVDAKSPLPEAAGPCYACASDEEMLPMAFTLRRDGRVLFRIRKTHWWLTGFKLGEFSQVKTLTMDARIRFSSRAMRDAFLTGLKEAGYHPGEYSVRRNTVSIHFAAPHTSQPANRGSLQETLVQKTNKTNCALFMQLTGKYEDTLDRLEYLEAMAPELFAFCMRSLYGKAFYDLLPGAGVYTDGNGSGDESGSAPEPSPGHPCRECCPARPCGMPCVTGAGPCGYGCGPCGLCDKPCACRPYDSGDRPCGYGDRSCGSDCGLCNPSGKPCDSGRGPCCSGDKSCGSDCGLCNPSGKPCGYGCGPCGSGDKPCGCIPCDSCGRPCCPGGGHQIPCETPECPPRRCSSCPCITGSDYCPHTTRRGR